MPTPELPPDPQRTIDHRPTTPTELPTVDHSQPDVATDATGAYVPTLPPETPTLPGYRITALIARGGMGCVYAAHDLVLGREVAIKTLLPGANADRFVVEAKITAQLPHPGIPPVHTLGTMADGTPYLVMKLIRGQTLADLLKKRVHPKDDLGRFVQVFEQIAQAVGFAHRHGIIHRDLKPLNVMVGELGEVQVMDWGLAKHLDHGATDAPATRSEDTAPAMHELTHAGAIMGTPGYMAPEQARSERVDQRADVFALGAILATLLTGKPAFTGNTAMETITKAANADLADVLARLDQCAADAELLALAKRCLAANVADRPADARVVATEVEAYRTGVEARLRHAETERAAAVVREGEQRKRQKTLLWAGGLITAVLVAGIVGTGIGLYKADQRRQEADEARRREKDRADGEAAERVVANKASDQTIDALEAMVSEASNQSLISQKTVSAKQNKFLNEVLKYYDEFIARSGNDERSRSRTARATYQVGMMKYRLGRREEGARTLVKARDLFLALLADYPHRAEDQRALIRCRSDLHVLLKNMGQFADAEAECRAALVEATMLDQQWPNVPEYPGIKGRSRADFAAILADLGQHEAALKEFPLAIQELTPFATQGIESQEFRHSLAVAHQNQGNVLTALGHDPKRVLAELQKALALEDGLAKEVPESPDYRSSQASLHLDIGETLNALGKTKEAEAELRKAVAQSTQLALEIPGIPDLHNLVAATRHALGRHLQTHGQTKEAEAEFRAAITCNSKIAYDNPTVWHYRTDLAMQRGDLAELLGAEGKKSEAENESRQAVEIWRTLVRQSLTRADFLRSLCNARRQFAIQLENNDKPNEARQEFGKVIADIEAFHQAKSGPPLDIELGVGYLNLGISYTEEPAKAVDFFSKAIDAFQRADSNKMRDDQSNGFWRACYQRRAQLRQHLGDAATAVSDWDRAIELSPPAERRFMRVQRAIALLESGKTVEAIKEVDELKALPGWPAPAWYDFACLYSLASGIIAARQTELADLALVALRKAVELGYNDAAHMKEDKDFDNVRMRDDFKKLLAEVEAKAPKKMPPPK